MFPLYTHINYLPYPSYIHSPFALSKVNERYLSSHFIDQPFLVHVSYLSHSPHKKTPLSYFLPFVVFTFIQPLYIITKFSLQMTPIRNRNPITFQSPPFSFSWISLIFLPKSHVGRTPATTQHDPTILIPDLQHLRPQSPSQDEPER